MENLTPPANGKNAPDGAPPAAPVQPDQVQPEPLRPDQCQRQQPGTGTGSSPAAHDMHRDAPGAADRTASADRRPEQQRTTRRRPGLFLLRRLPACPACPACRISSPARAGCCAAVVPMTTPAHRSRSRSHRPPPAPGRISTASAAPDDHASSRPPPTMTTHQRQPCTTCTAPTACQPCQTSQQQRSRQRRHQGGQARQRRPPAACIAAACRMIHPAAPRKTAILPRRRRGQILHLTG